MALFTPEELEELRKDDAELDEQFVQTQEEINESRKRDKAFLYDRLDRKSKKIAENKRAYYEANREKIAENKRAYYEANREKIAENQRAYYEANREKIAENQRAYREANREKMNAYLREYRKRKKEQAAMKGVECHA